MPKIDMEQESCLVDRKYFFIFLCDYVSLVKCLIIIYASEVDYMITEDSVSRLILTIPILSNTVIRLLVNPL